MADSLHYVPMPAKVVSMIEKTWSQELKGPGGAPVWTANRVQK